MGGAARGVGCVGGVVLLWPSLGSGPRDRGVLCVALLLSVIVLSWVSTRGVLVLVSLGVGFLALLSGGSSTKEQRVVVCKLC